MISKYLLSVGAHALSRGAFAQPVATGERRSSSPCQAPSLGTSIEKEVPTKKTQNENLPKSAVSGRFLIINKVLGDTADWESVRTAIAAGWEDTATKVIQAVRVSTWDSSTRPQVAERRLIAEAAAIEIAAPSSVKWISLYIIISICHPRSV